LVSNDDNKLQISQLQEQHPPKSHDKPSPPVTTRQSARKRLLCIIERLFLAGYELVMFFPRYFSQIYPAMVDGLQGVH
jgi:hypothetical protein